GHPDQRRRGRRRRAGARAGADAVRPGGLRLRGRARRGAARPGRRRARDRGRVDRPATGRGGARPGTALARRSTRRPLILWCSMDKATTKHLFVTGGVASSLGKGLTASSLGNLLKARGL